MYPVYQFMDSFPHQMNQMPSTPHHHHHHHRHPRFEVIPGQMKADFERCPSCYQSSYGYQYPSQYHGCCDHNYFPGCCMPRPPYAHASPPYYHCTYPVPLGAYPVHCNPPPNYTMEPSHYKYHMEIPGYSHCCSSPNQTCNWTPGKNVKIEEENPDSEKKVNYSLVPFDFKSHPSPVVWDPPACMMSKANNKSKESQSVEREKYSGATKADETSKPSEQQQKFLNGWFPFDVENCGLENQGGDSRKQQHLDEGKRQFSFPLFWMPWNPDEMKRNESTKNNLGQESVRTIPSRSEVTPMMVPDAEEKTSAAKANEETNSHECLKTLEKNNAQKTVPEKPAEPEENKTPEENEEKVKSSLAKNVNSSEEKKSSQTSGRSKSSSPTKSSKLPPICLRVDPLRKKSNTDGSSRSPSPPADKGKLRELSKDSAQPPTSSTAKEIAEQDMTVRENVPENTKDVEQSMRKLKTIEVTERTSSQKETENLNIAHPHGSCLMVNSHDAVQTNDKSEEVLPDAATAMNSSSAMGKNNEHKSIDSTCQMDEDTENSKGHESSGDKTKESAKIKLSEAEAALVIQSVYRGYEVRRWEPLKKLKRIANISEEVVKLKNQIQALESCSNTQDNDKWRTILGESIMNLLLKLDTIQGLHPSIRDVRKSVARELVSLQEKLDHLSLNKSESEHELGSGAKSDKDTQIVDNTCFQGGGEEKRAFLESRSSKTENVHDVYPEELSQGASPSEMDNTSNSGSLEFPETARNKEHFGDGSHKPVTDLLEVNTTETNEAGLLPETGATDGSTNLVCNGGQGQSSEFPLPEVSEKMIHGVVEGAASPVMDEVSNLKQLEELPKGVLDPDTKLQDNDLLLLEAGNDKALQGEVVMETNAHVQELTEMPQGMPDNVEESRKHVILEEKDDKVIKDEVTMEDIQAEVRDGENLNMDQAEQQQESMVKVPVNSESNDRFACQESTENNVELHKAVDFASHDIPVQALEEDKSCIPKLGDASQVHDGVASKMDAEVLDSFKNALDRCCAKVEKEEFTTPAEPVEVYKAEEQVVQDLAILESETQNGPQIKNGVSDLKNSPICKDGIAVSSECDDPMVSTELCNVETEQKLIDEAIEIEASGLAIGDNKFVAQTCDSAALGEVTVDQMESAPLGATEREEELPPSSPPASQISFGSNASTEHERKLVEENEKLREMMEKLIEAGKEQLTAISNLSGRVKDLEKKLSRKKKLRIGRHNITRYTSGLSCLEPSNDALNEKPVQLAM